MALDLSAAAALPEPPVFDAGGLDVEEPPPAPPEESSAPGGLLARVLPGARVRHEEAIAAAREDYERALREHADREERRKRALAEALAAHERAVAEAQASAAAGSRRVEELRARIDAGDAPANAAYLAAVLAASDYPPGFPRRSTVALDPAARMLVVDYELPGLEVVPAVQALRYDERADAFEDVPRPASRRKDLYGVVVASVALRSVKELFEADKARTIDRIGFNGYVHGIDRVTEEPVRPYLVSVQATREEFRQLDIARADPIVSIRSLEAAFSTNPAELAPVRQVVGAKAAGPGSALATSPDL